MTNFFPKKIYCIALKYDFVMHRFNFKASPFPRTAHNFLWWYSSQQIYYAGKATQSVQLDYF